MDKRALIVVGVILIIPLVLLGIWAFQGQAMEGDFSDALSNNSVRGVHVDLQGKKWSAAELSSVEVLKVPAGAGRERAVARSVHGRGRILVSPILYEYQGTVRDGTTGIVHVFGYRRSEPRHWCWEALHPDSMALHMQRRMEQLDEMKKQAAKQ